MTALRAKRFTHFGHTTTPSFGIHPQNHIFAAVHALAEGNSHAALSAVQPYLSAVSCQAAPVERLAHLFATSLAGRIQGESMDLGNLYMAAEQPEAMLAAFQTLVEATPLVKFGYASGNAAIVHTAIGAERLAIIDLGIGGGTQWLPLLDALAAQPGAPRQIAITGVDFPECGADPAAWLDQVGEMLGRYARRLGFQLSFRAVPSAIEDVEVAALRPEQDATLVINAAFALHHIAAADETHAADQPRDRLLCELAALQPRLFTLIEPDVEHNALPFAERVEASWRHYTSVFELLHSVLAPDLRERLTIERAFFGREIRNIVIGEGLARVERHERRQSWHRRMQACGFQQVDIGEFAETTRQAVYCGQLTSVVADQGMLSLGWAGTPLIAASAWRV